MPQPKLILLPYRYKAGAAYAVIPEDGSGDFTVVRAGDTATRVNSSGLIESVLANVPRIDYLNGSCPVVLDEPAATNFALHSNDFGNAAYIKTNCAESTNNRTSPDGTVNADTITLSPGTLRKSLGQIISPTFGGDKNGSWFIEDFDGLRYFQIFMNGGFGWCNFDLQTNTFSTPQMDAFNPQIVDYGNGWKRISLASNFATTDSVVISVVDSLSATYAQSTSQTGAYGLYQYQFEAGAEATSAIFTGATVVTRNADDISVTVPSGVSEIVTTFEDNTTQVVTSIPSTFTLPTGRIKSVVMI